MRIFISCEEATREVERDLFELGVDVKIQTMQDKIVDGDVAYMTRELTPYSFQMIDTARKDKNFFLEYFNIPIDWAVEEFNERITYLQVGINPGLAWLRRASLWEEFLHDGYFAYTYHDRMQPQLEKVVQELKVRPGSRQVVMTIYNAQDQFNWGGSARIPCSLYYQFLIRESKLDLIYAMRSNDFLTFWGSDNWFALSLQEHVAARLGLAPGRYTYFTGSLHAYHKDLKARGIF